jgi:anti-sigma B factor antagonist
MNDGLVVDLTHLDGSALLIVRGQLDMASAPAFRSAMEQAMALEIPVLVDCDGVTFMDSSGLNVLLLAQKNADRPGLVRVLNPSRQVRRLLAMTGLEHLTSPDVTVSSETDGV